MDEPIGYRELRAPFEDWELYWRLAAAEHRGARLDRVIYHYRVHGAERRFATMRARLPGEIVRLRATYPALWAARRDLRRASALGWHWKLMLPVADVLQRRAPRIWWPLRGLMERLGFRQADDDHATA